MGKKRTPKPVRFRKPFRAVPLQRIVNRPPKPIKFWREKKSWGQAFHETRPFLLGIALLTLIAIWNLPGAYEPPRFLQSTPEPVFGHFTRCGPGRGTFCVIDGDTFKIDQRSIRVVGIDTAEVDARCPAEAAQAEASTLALQQWLNRGAFEMVARLDDPVDRYGRDLRTVRRVSPTGEVDRLADWMREHGGARSYWRGLRGGWC